MVGNMIHLSRVVHRWLSVIVIYLNNACPDLAHDHGVPGDPARGDIIGHFSKVSSDHQFSIQALHGIQNGTVPVV